MKVDLRPACEAEDTCVRSQCDTLIQSGPDMCNKSYLRSQQCYTSSRPLWKRVTGHGSGSQTELWVQRRELHTEKLGQVQSLKQTMAGWPLSLATCCFLSRGPQLHPSYWLKVEQHRLWCVLSCGGITPGWFSAPPAAGGLSMGCINNRIRGGLWGPGSEEK